MKTREQITSEISDTLVPLVHSGVNLMEVIAEVTMQELGAPEEEQSELKAIIQQVKTMVDLMAKVYTNPKVIDKLVDFMDKSEKLKAVTNA